MAEVFHQAQILWDSERRGRRKVADDERVVGREINDQRGERVLMSYSFGVLPQLVYETIMKLATLPVASR